MIPEKGDKTRPLKVLFFGSGSPLSTRPLRFLLAQGVRICAFMTAAPLGERRTLDIRLVPPEPSPPDTIKVGTDDNPVQIAHDHGIPVYETGRRSGTAARSVVAALQPDVILSACFPMRIPGDLLDEAPLGGFNLHPSLLPKFRGPDPLFWVFYRGIRRTGVTVHRMTQRLDAGDIAAQTAWSMENGISGSTLLMRCAEAGGRLFLDVLTALAENTLIGLPQDETQSSYYTWPDDRHRVITPDRPARWAYNFIRGIDRETLYLDYDGMRYRISEAVGFSISGKGHQALRVEGNHLWVPCTPGLLHVIGHRISSSE